VGGSEKNVRDTFDGARKAAKASQSNSCVLFFDELDR
jgi:SpoVK/Ycf46/Vps4 family AAA+-type ATPase